MVSRDVVFDETVAWDLEDLGSEEAVGGNSGGTFTIEHMVIYGGGDAGVEAEAAQEAPSPCTQAPAPSTQAA